MADFKRIRLLDIFLTSRKHTFFSIFLGYFQHTKETFITSLRRSHRILKIVRHIFTIRSTTMKVLNIQKMS